MKTANKSPLRYLVSSPKINGFKRKLLQPNSDVKVFRKLSTATTSMEALTLRSKNQTTVEKTPSLKATFWSRLAELHYLESEAA